jgi:hypothetical protein
MVLICFGGEILALDIDWYSRIQTKSIHQILHIKHISEDSGRKKYRTFPKVSTFKSRSSIPHRPGRGSAARCCSSQRVPPALAAMGSAASAWSRAMAAMDCGGSFSDSFIMFNLFSDTKSNQLFIFLILFFWVGMGEPYF